MTQAVAVPLMQGAHTLALAPRSGRVLGLLHLHGARQEHDLHTSRSAAAAAVQPPLLLLQAQRRRPARPRPPALLLPLQQRHLHL